jgi:hypothetical protein
LGNSATTFGIQGAALMKRNVLIGAAGLAILALATASASARAMAIRPKSIPLRVAGADAIVVGKVTGFGDRTVPAERFAGDKANYQIAVVKVEKDLKGKVGMEIKVGFIPPMAGPGGGPGRIIRPGFRGGVNLTIGHEACYFLVKHPKKDFYTVNNFADFINKTPGGKPDPNFAKVTEEVQHAIKLLAKPKEGLKSKKAEDRLITAAMLIDRYRTPPPGVTEPRTEPIDREISKLIFEALANADWKVNLRAWDANPQNLFYRLGIGPKEGWVPPKDFKEFPAEAKKWLKENAGTVRIQRFVRAGEKG